MRKSLFPALLLFALQAPAQHTTEVSEFNLAGPFAVEYPFAADTVDVGGKQFDEQSLLSSVRYDAPANSRCQAGRLPSLEGGKSVGVLSFHINNSDYTKGTVTVKGPSHYQLYIDGAEAGTDLKLAPEHHTLAIKYLAQPSDTDSISVSIDASRPLSPTLSAEHPYMVHDLTDGRRLRSISLSADGAFAALAYQTTFRGGESRWNYEVRDVPASMSGAKQSQRLVCTPHHSVRWMPRACAYIEDVRENAQRQLYKVDPRSGERTLLAANVPSGDYHVSPAEDYLIFSIEEEGPKEDHDVFQVLEMDDRQPGWRNRNYLARYDLTTGLLQRITFGTHGQYLYDISSDGSRLLIGTSRSRLERRPTTVTDFFLMDAHTLAVDTVLTDTEFIDMAHLSPDGSQILFMGSPEAFDRLGCQLPTDVTPSMTENELFLYDIATRKATPLTRDFDPSVSTVRWSRADGNIYLSAEDRDFVHLYRLNPKTGHIGQLPLSGDDVYQFSLAGQAPFLAYLAYNTMEPASGYAVNLKSGKSLCYFDGKTALGSARLGTCQDWNFQNSNGDTVYGRLYLPADFDPARQYPMIVYYYGGCSPVSRYFESPYSAALWNSLGYVAYILQPSGATGFGQEWASRHVNTAGGKPTGGIVPGGTPAGDIIEGVKRICDEHPFINRQKIGCMGASYGGFMTQYLQTVTDIFACAVSHAGITNHTSYWGEGYWGYNYSEVSMANSYPWSHRQLYVDQSPLFNADKIHTPLLLLHGNADTNVPLIESLQMFAALKLLGREVALVEVEGENHHILSYGKKLKWLATQMAWFQRWLKDDTSWWDALYPPKNL